MSKSKGDEAERDTLVVATDPREGKEVTTSLVKDAAGREHVVLGRCRLEVVAGPDKGASFVSDGNRFVIGTRKTSDLILHDRSVTGFHCEIILSERTALLRDLESRNGTRIDGVRVDVGYLHPGALIQIGRTQAAFHVQARKVQIPLSDRTQFGDLVGRSVAMRSVFHQLETAAESSSTVLLEGETGTGKDRAAEAIHRGSSRRERPFVVVDCAGLPPTLLEAELFGHERGAFTGAIGRREGAFEAADGGTVFLDEIGELPLDLQPKLLRLLERRQVKRVGSNDYRSLDVRIIAATNRNLSEEVNEKRFRSDLYYRLAVMRIRLPPLRERKDDLPMLAQHFLERRGVTPSPESDRPLAPDLMAELARHRWPGNVRELYNYLERYLVTQERPGMDSEAATPTDIEPLFNVDAGVPLSVMRQRYQRFERDYLEATLKRANGRVAAAARLAGVPREAFYRLLAKHALK